MTNFDAGPGLLVSEKAAFAVTPLTEALTIYAPAVVFAVKAGALATPLAFVVAWAVVTLPGKVPLAPLVGAVNVTVALFIGFPPLSFTVACSSVWKAFPTVALWVAPPVAVIEFAGPVRFVKAKLTVTAFGAVPAEACTL